MKQLQSNHHADVGRFMVAVGAIMECTQDGTILVVKRAPVQDFRPNEWEVTYGRMSQFEEPVAALKREHKEEVGFDAFAVIRVQRVWHMYRGNRSADTELVGITYLCRVNKKPVVRLSKEHTEFKWVTPQEALALVSSEGIKEDIRVFIKSKT